MWTLSGFADEIAPDLDEQCGVLGDLGTGWVEFRSAWGINVLDLDDGQLDRARRTFALHGLRVSAVASPVGKAGVHDDFGEQLRRFRRALRVASVLEAPYIRIFSFFLPDGDPPAWHRDEVLARLSALTGEARGHDVVLAHENEKNIYGDTPERCRDIAESVGSPQLRLVWDPANFVQCRVRPYTDGYGALRPYLAYVQVKDALLPTGEVVPAGEGDGEIRAMVRALRADRFDGFFSLEPHLAAAGRMGGFSGAALFGAAHRAFTRLLDDQAIDYR